MKNKPLPFKFVDKDKPCYAPIRGTEKSAGLDLHAVENVILQPKEIRPLSTNIAIELSNGTEAQIRGRSGLAFNHNVFCIHLGTIDADYRGEIKLLLYNASDKEFKINPGDRIAQLVVNQVEYVSPIEIQELSDTERGEGGFGSTGYN